MCSELADYTFEQKERLARRIQKLKKQKYLSDIENIIIKYNPDIDITTNPHGKFMYFQDLKKETYYKLEKYVQRILKLKTLSETSDNTQYMSDIIKYSEEDDPFSNNPKLRYSNKERNLIKRKIYDKQINEGSDSEHETSQFRSSTEENNIETNSDKQENKFNNADKELIQTPSQNNVFVKRKNTSKVTITKFN